MVESRELALWVKFNLNPKADKFGVIGCHLVRIKNGQNIQIKESSDILFEYDNSFKPSRQSTTIYPNNPPKLKETPMPTTPIAGKVGFSQSLPKYVVFCSQRGIWLGNNCWSYKNPNGRSLAPTFETKTDGARAVTEANQLGQGIEYREVWADVYENEKWWLSIEACCNHMLPRWEPGVAK